MIYIICTIELIYDYYNLYDLLLFFHVLLKWCYRLNVEATATTKGTSSNDRQSSDEVTKTPTIMDGVPTVCGCGW